MATNPFEQPLASEQAKATPTAGNPFDAPLHSEQQPQQAEQPGFLSRAYETSPLPGMLDAAKQSISDFVKTPDQATQAFNEMVGSLRQGNFSDAAHHAAKLLVGQENPFQDAAKSVVNTIVKDAHTTGRDLLNQVPGAQAAKNYIADVKSGNTGAAVGDVVGGVSSIAPMLLGDEASAAKAGDVVSKASDAVADTAGKARTLVSEDAAAQTAQPGVQDAVRNTAADTAASEGVQPKAAPSVRDAVQNTADSVLERSKGTYQQLDDLSGGRWQRFSDSIKNLRDKADEVAGIDDTKFDEYSQRAQDIEQAQADLVDNLVKDGKIDADTAQSAVKDYRKAQSLYDLSQQIRNSTKGVPADVAGPGSTPEMIDASQLLPKLNKLRDSGRLASAIGEDGAGQLIRDVDTAARTKTAAIARVKLIRTIGKYAAVGAGLGALGHGAASLLGGH